MGVEPFQDKSVGKAEYVLHDLLPEINEIIKVGNLKLLKKYISYRL